MKRLLMTIVVAFSVVALYGQAKKPTIMVVPSDPLCVKKGYVHEFVAYGAKTVIPDYQKAIQNDSELGQIIAAIGGIMAKEEFPLKSLENTLKSIGAEGAELSLIAGDVSGMGVAESPIDKLNRTANPDIILQVDYGLTKQGPKRQVSVSLTAVDSYTSKIISGNNGVSSLLNAPIETLLAEAVLSFKDSFLASLQKHFDDMFAQGREVVINFRRIEDSDVDFSTEFDYQGEGVELADIIELWFSENTISGRYTLSERSENILRFDQVRIPLYGKNIAGKEVGIDTRGFVRPLVNILKKEPYYLPVSVYQKGLGEVLIVIGE